MSANICIVSLPSSPFFKRARTTISIMRITIACDSSLVSLIAQTNQLQSATFKRRMYLISHSHSFTSSLISFDLFLFHFLSLCFYHFSSSFLLHVVDIGIAEYLNPP